MKYLIKIIAILLFTINCTQVLAQSNSLNFTIQSNQVSALGENFTTDSTINKLGETIVWTQIKDGVSDTMSFNITDSSGTWDQSTSLGSITYNMAFEDYQCELILSNQGTNVLTTLVFNLNGVEEARYSFINNLITYQ